MRMSFRMKLTGAFLAVTLIGLALVGVLANVLLEKQFESYVLSNLAQKRAQVVTTLENGYRVSNGGGWRADFLENIGMNALDEGLILRVSGADGSVLWDAMKHNNGMCVELLQNMARNMKSRNAGFRGGYTEKRYDLTVSGKSVGSISIGYYGPYFYTDNDLRFLTILNRLLALAAVVAGTMALVVSSVVARRLTRPISHMIQAAEQISGGNYCGRITEESGTKELYRLTDALNVLAERLERQEILRRQLTADVAHELRTPIANLQSHLEAMQDGIWPADAERLGSCHEEVMRMSKIVGDLTALARYDGENVYLHCTPLDLSDLVRSVALGFENAYRGKGVALTVSVGVLPLEADRDKLAQILINLLSNALKYTQSGGTVTVSAEDTGDAVRLVVRDTGIGIAKDDLPFIFERFFRADKSRSRLTGGSGIGLAITKSLVAAHGGTISVKSELGSGSEFTVCLPRRQTVHTQKDAYAGHIPVQATGTHNF